MFKKEMSKEDLTQLAVTYLKEQGACEVGVVTKETLAGGPPSTDLEYVLQDAESAISFAIPLDEQKIYKFLSKEDRKSVV